MDDGRSSCSSLRDAFVKIAFFKLHLIAFYGSARLFEGKNQVARNCFPIQ